MIPFKRINSAMAALIYFLGGYLLFSNPFEPHEVAAASVGAFAMAVLFYNYQRLAEKVANGQVVLVAGKFYPVEKD